MNKNELLAQMLDCKEYELSVLDNIVFNVHDILNELGECGEKINLENIIRVTMEQGVKVLTKVLKDEIIKEYCNGDRLKALYKFNPKEDIKFIIGKTNKYAYYNNNKELYDEYLFPFPVIFKALTGFELK